jgi:hypothetical protein
VATMWQFVDGADDASGACSEDRAGVSGDVAWILDGASAVSQEQLSRQPSDAHRLVGQLDDELKRLAPESLPLEKLVTQAIQRTAARVAEHWPGPAPEIPASAALGIVRRTGLRTEFLLLADVSVIMATDAGVFEFSDQRVEWGNEQAQVVMTSLVRGGASWAAARQQANPLLADRRRSAMNRPGGYWVASIDENAVQQALTGALDGVREVVLATDGFMRALRPFKLIADLPALFPPEPNFDDLVARIRAAERHDPETRNYPRWTVRDDICAQRLRWIDD